MKTIGQEFVDKVRSMTVKGIILAMVEGLRDPKTEVDMSTYGRVGYSGLNYVCYGCAATNTMCQLNGWTYTEVISIMKDQRCIDGFSRIADTHEIRMFVAKFELAVDYLRRGELGGYNSQAECIGLATIPHEFLSGALLYLGDDYTEEDLIRFVEFANKIG